MSKLKYTALILIALCAGAIGAVLIQTNLYPQNGTVEAAVQMEVYVEGELWPDGTPIEWFTLTPGTWGCELNVTNTGNIDANIMLTITGLPEGWTETWTGNNTVIIPGNSVVADIVLTVPVGALAGYYSWDSSVIAEAT